MTISTRLGGFLYDASGARQQIPMVFNPDGLTIKAAIEKVTVAGSGIIVLSNTGNPEFGPEKLELYMENGNFLLMLGVNEEDGDYSVRTLPNGNVKKGLMTVMGEKYPAEAVTTDVGRVLEAFNEFSQSGDVAFMRP